MKLEPGQTVTVGRDLGSDLPVLDAGISRHHASFTLEGDELWLEDLHSQNGTFVNTERVRRARILPGDIITFGRVPLMISIRAPSVAEVDPIRGLPQESLAQLVHLMKELGSEKSRAMLFQKLLEVALRAVQADRGLVLLWEERRDHFHTVAASPQDLFQHALGVVSHPLALSIVRTGKARLLGDSLAAGAGSVLVAPVKSSTGAVGLLYLDRAATRPAFKATELELVTAFTWASAAALQAHSDSQTPPVTDESLSLRRQLRKSARTLAGSRGSAPDLTEGSAPEALLLELERHVLARTARLAAARGSDAARLEETTASLHAARLGIEGVRRLLEDGAVRLEEVTVERLAGELTALDRSHRRYRVASGGDQSALVDSQTLLLVLRIHGEELGGARSAPGEPAELSLAGLPSPEEGLVIIRLARGAAPDAEPGTADADPRASLDSFLLELAGRLTHEVLHGKVELDLARGAVDVHVPQPAASWRETLLLRPTR